MESHSSQCFICSIQFSTPEKLREHVWHYQTEITALFVRLHQLLAHQDQGPRQPKVTGHPRRAAIKQRGKSEARSSSFRLNPAPFAQEELGSPTGVTEAVTTLKFRPKPSMRCPHDDCQNHSNTFTRTQDLVRHFARHVRCDEFCTFCSTTYTQAHKYIGHKCVSRGPEHQRAYIKTRVDALRDRARRELSDKDNIDKLQPDLNHAKRLKPVHPRSTDDASIVSFPRLHTVNALREPHLSHATPGSLAQSVPATTVSVALDELNAHQPANSPATQPAHNVDMDGVASFTYQPYNLTPLFSPLNSDWQSQLQLPDPLWALQPANSEGSLMGFLGGLSSSKDLVGVVEPSDDVASSEPSFAM